MTDKASEPFRLLITGGRDFSDRKALYSSLDDLHREGPITTLINGGAAGADTLAAQWASRHQEVAIHTFYAKWEKFGKSAGVIRNQKMILEGRPDVVLVCPGGRGTQDMVTRCRRHKIPFLWLDDATREKYEIVDDLQQSMIQ